MTGPEPFFTAPGTPLSRRGLLVSVAHVPSSEVGALRWRRIAAAATGHGWTFDVITILTPVGPLRDDATLADVTAGSRLYTVELRLGPLGRLEQRLRRSARAIRPTQALVVDRRRGGPGAAAAPHGIDRRGVGRAAAPGVVGGALRRFRSYVHFERWDAWVERATALGRALLRETRYDLVASSGPPHFSHEVARRLAEWRELPLVLDLRDPWYSDDVEPLEMRGAYWRRRTERLERAAVERADLVVANTDSSRRLLSARYATRADRMITVCNGADGDVEGPTGDLATFTIAYAGDLYGGRDPETLFRAVGRVVKRRAIAPDSLRVEIMGGTSYNGVPLEAMAAEHGIGAYVSCRDRGPRAEALDLLRRSAMLVLLPQQHVHSVPAKTFEYVQRPAWILSFADPASATGALFAGTAADCVAPGDVEGAALHIERRFEEFQRGVRPAPLNADGRFDRSHQVARLMSALDALVPPSRATAVSGAA